MNHRRAPRLQEIFTAQPLYFVTFCTAHRARILNNEEAHQALIQYAEYGAEHQHIAVGRYVIMPDHVHIFVAGPEEFSLTQWERGLKRVIGKALPGSSQIEQVWQHGFFDHLLRCGESYEQKWEYVRANPVRAGLVKKEIDWPYRGEIVKIAWRL